MQISGRVYPSPARHWKAAVRFHVKAAEATGCGATTFALERGPDGRVGTRGAERAVGRAVGRSGVSTRGMAGSMAAAAVGS